MIDSTLLQFCTTDRQREILEKLIELQSVRGTARQFNTQPAYIRKVRDTVRQRAAAQGYLPELGIESPFPNTGHIAKGYSRYKSLEDGGVWIKTDVDKQKYLELVRATVDELKSDIKPIKPIARKHKATKKSLLNLYVLSDLHIGALSWHEETGDDWDTSIAERIVYDAFEMLTESTQHAETGFLCQLGDGLHYDSLTAETPSSKHIVDSDSRYHRIVRCALRVFRRVIDLMLSKYRRVVVLMAQGNHDLASSVWLQECFATLYERNKRCQIIVSPKPYYSYVHGRCFLAFHHGHRRKPAQLAEVFSGSNYWQELAGCRQAYIHSGHQHHHQILETNFGISEMHPTIAGRSSYEAHGGYDSDRRMNAITYHADGYEQSRVSFYPGRQ